MKKIILSVIIIINTLLLTGCLFTSAISTAIVVSNDRRTTGEIIDDKGISFNLSSWNLDDKTLADAHLNFMIYKRKVLVTGEVPNATVRDYIAKQIPLKDFKVRKVINETHIAPNSGLLSRAKDSAITGQVEALFLDQDVFNPIHVKVTTEDRTVYLMGAVTVREANKATKIAALAGGVERVIKLFHYLKNRPAAEIERDKQRKIEAQKKAELDKKQAIINIKKAKLRQQIRALDSKSDTEF